MFEWKLLIAVAVTFAVIWSAYAIPGVSKIPVMGCADIKMLYHWGDDYPLENTYAYLNTLTGENAWLDYPREGESPQWGIKHGFLGDTVPKDKIRILRLSGDPSKYYPPAVDLWFLPHHPDMVLLLIYQTTEPFTDAQGDHYGEHPCAAFIIEPDEALTLIALSKVNSKVE